MAKRDAGWDDVWGRAGAVSGGADVPGSDRDDPRWVRIRRTLDEADLDPTVLRTVELGAGRGDYSTLFASIGSAATLIDLSPIALNAARERFADLHLPATFLEADLFRLPQRLTGSFDVSLSFGLVEHFRGGRQMAVAAAHARLVRPGGLVIISVPYAMCLPYRLQKFYLEVRGWWPYPDEYPLSRGALRGLARAAGLVPRWTMTSGYRRATFALAGAIGLPRSADRRRPHPLDRCLGMDLTLCAQKPPD